MKSRILILAAAALLAACGGNTQKKAAAGGAETVAEAPDMHTAETSLDYQGTYTGTFPAADCPGIDTRLVLKKDGTCDLHMKYLERDSEFEDKGGYSVKGNLLTLTPENGEGIEYYKVEENRLRRLDADKQPITGPLAENYVLKKTE